MTHHNIILITGAPRRIGAAIATHLATSGAAVVLHASERSLGEAERLAQKIRMGGGAAATIAADLAHAPDVERLMGKAAQTFGPVNGLVNNASLFTPDAAYDFTCENFDRHIAVNLRAPLLLSAALVNQLPQDADGSIVNILDQRVLRPTPEYFTYSASKSALWSATRTMAQAFAPRVRVNAVGPGPVLPNIHEGSEGFAAEAARVPLQHSVAPQEIAEAVLYLLNARSVTGQLIAVDAGQHLE